MMTLNHPCKISRLTPATFNFEKGGIQTVHISESVYILSAKGDMGKGGGVRIVHFQFQAILGCILFVLRSVMVGLFGTAFKNSHQNPEAENIKVKVDFYKK